MVDITTVSTMVAAGAGVISSLVGSAKTVKDMLDPRSEPVSVDDYMAVRLKVLEMIDLVFNAKETQETLIDKIAALETENLALKKELSRKRDFRAKKDTYIRRALSRYSFAYMHKEITGTDKDLERFCVPCFEKDEESLLCFEQHDPAGTRLKCPACQTGVLLEHSENQIRGASRPGNGNNGYFL